MSGAFNLTERVRAWTTAFDHKNVCGCEPNLDAFITLTTRLIEEEAEELCEALWELHEAWDRGDAERLQALRHVAQEGADLVWVTLKAMVRLNIPFYSVFARLWASNMSKLFPDGKPRTENGKTIKPPTFVPLDLSDVVALRFCDHSR